MIEDCMCLLLDVDDIDRMFIMADGFREDEMQLRQRRSLLMEGFAASLRLPDTSMLNITPPPAASQDARLESSDGVFLRLMALHKGRVMLARALRLLYPSPQAEARSMGVGPVRSPPLRLAWALLRNLRVLFTPGGLRAAPGAGQSSPSPVPSFPLPCALLLPCPQLQCQGLQFTYAFCVLRNQVLPGGDETSCQRWEVWLAERCYRSSSFKNDFPCNNCQR